jgi:hypothetical protein
MKRTAIMAAGLVAALLTAGAARAGALDVLYWGKDSHASVVIDGQTYDLGAKDDWIAVQNIYPGDHTMTLYANGATTTGQFTLSDDNVAYTGGDNGPAWCMDLEDDTYELLGGDECDEMTDYWYYGD